MDKIISNLQHSIDTGAEVSDEDLRQLVIHYATLLYHAEIDRIEEVKALWAKWPIELYARFSALVLGSSDRFWARPVEINRKFGLIH